MIESWWDAHELEVVFGAIALGVTAIIWLWVSLDEAYQERKQKKKDGLL